MRRWLLLPIVAALSVPAACGNGSDDATGDDAHEVVTDLDRAVEVARLSVPRSLGDDVVAELIADLCAAAGSGDAAAVAAGLQAAPIDAADVPLALEAIAAGASTYCPDDVTEVVPTVETALAPAADVAPAPEAAAADGSGGGAATTGQRSSSASSGPASSNSSSSSSSNGSSGSTNSSSGSADVGGGNATGTGNSSSTGLTQGIGSSNSSSSADGSTSNVSAAG